MESAQIRRLQAAVVDGRAHNVYYRQTQLQRLCQSLLEKEAALRSAMISDSGYTTSEAITILHSSVQAVKDAYASLQPIQALEDEYRIAHGKSAPDNEIPFGLVYIEPELHTLLYSICGALSAAIVAGNCVALLLENTLRTLPGLIRTVLTDALDADTFAVITTPLEDQRNLDDALTIRRQKDESRPRGDEVLSCPDSVAIAVVDRTADIAVAARELAQARRAFSGRSPYAPDIVLVNEFVIEAFIDALVVESGGEASNLSIEQHDEKDVTEGLLSVDLRRGTASPADSACSTAQSLQTKTHDLVLRILSVRSLDDAINILDEHPKDAYLAAYHFCDLPSAKYLSQFVDAEVTFVNHIPRAILIGPAAPNDYTFSLRHRYPASAFSKPRPVFVETPSESQRLATALSSGDNITSHALLEEAKQPLKAMKRSEGGGVGFFEQGFLMNASFILVSFVTLSVTGAWQLWRYRRS